MVLLEEEAVRAYLDRTDLLPSLEAGIEEMLKSCSTPSDDGSKKDPINYLASWLMRHNPRHNPEEAAKLAALRAAAEERAAAELAELEAAEAARLAAEADLAAAAEAESAELRAEEAARASAAELISLGSSLQLSLQSGGSITLRCKSK